MHYHTEDTIAAIASAPGGAYRGVVRVSGDDVLGCLEPIFHSENGDTLSSLTQATAIPGRLSVSQFRRPLECSLYLWPTSRSFTRQPLAEIHTIGSPPLLQAVVQTLCDAGARLAEPGEFTLRAFLAGRIDLTQAEAVLGVIDAHGEQQLQGALAQLAGGLSAPLQKLRDELVEMLAHLEAGLDFVEEDIEFISHDALLRQLAAAAEQVSQLLEQMGRREASGDLLRVAIIGPPNAGKSSLFNALAGEQAAIVSPQRGTTRDYLTARTECHGAACLLIDTAGAEAISDVDSIGRRAQQMMGGQTRDAQLRVLCIDASRLPSVEQHKYIEELRRSADIVALTKCDRPRPSDFATPAGDVPFVTTSAHSGDGLTQLRSAIARLAQSQHEEAASVVSTTAARCRESLKQTIEHLRQAEQGVRAGLGEELVAAEIRIALSELGKVVGVVYTDDILDRVFSRFCIGK